jgi:hypothetical protein
MKSSWSMGAACALLVAGSALASDITFYEHDNFNGRRFTVTDSISDFANMGFNDRASSVSIRSGSWQLCPDAFFRGRCGC